MIADLGAVEQSSNGVSAPAVPAAGQGHFETRQSALAALGRKALAAPDVLLLMQDAASLLAETLNAPFACVSELVPERQCFSEPSHSAWRRYREFANQFNITKRIATGIRGSPEPDRDGS